MHKSRSQYDISIAGRTIINYMHAQRSGWPKIYFIKLSLLNHTLFVVCLCDVFIPLNLYRYLLLQHNLLFLKLFKGLQFEHMISNTVASDITRSFKFTLLKNRYTILGAPSSFRSGKPTSVDLPSTTTNLLLAQFQIYWYFKNIKNHIYIPPSTTIILF